MSNPVMNALKAESGKHIETHWRQMTKAMFEATKAASFEGQENCDRRGRPGKTKFDPAHRPKKLILSNSGPKK